MLKSNLESGRPGKDIMTEALASYNFTSSNTRVLTRLRENGYAREPAAQGLRQGNKDESVSR